MDLKIVNIDLLESILKTSLIKTSYIDVNPLLSFKLIFN